MPPPGIRSLLPLEIPTIDIVDVGAALEGEERYASLVAGGLARVTGFEPDEAQHAQLLAARPGGAYRYLRDFIGAGGPATLHVTRWPGCTSLYRPDPKVIDLFDTLGAAGPGGNFHVIRTEPVETRRLDDIPECPPADYLKLDVQGAELDVLRGAATSLARAVVIELEVEFVPLYENQPLFGDLQTFLRGHGFVLHKFLDVSGRCFRPWRLAPNPFIPLSQVLWADAVFVRDFAHLEAWSDDQLLRAVAILHEVYRSYDLAQRLLAELDKRQDRDLAQPYGRAVIQSGALVPYTMNFKQQP